MKSPPITVVAAAVQSPYRPALPNGCDSSSRQTPMGITKCRISSRRSEAPPATSSRLRGEKRHKTSYLAGQGLVGVDSHARRWQLQNTLSWPVRSANGKCRPVPAPPRQSVYRIACDSGPGRSTDAVLKSYPAYTRATRPPARHAVSSTRARPAGRAGAEAASVVSLLSSPSPAPSP